MHDSLFRAYDIRGLVGEQLQLDKVNDLAQAIISYFLAEKTDLQSIIVGMDGRTHSPTIKESVIQAATKLGINVVDIGVCPTPTFYFALFTSGVSSGIMITASHNPGNYNGMKLCLETKSVWGEQIQKIKHLYKAKEFAPNASQQGTVSTYDAKQHYITWLTDHFSHLQGKAVNAVIDCGNGAGGAIIPDLIKQMDLKNVYLLYPEVDGTFPNHPADPTRKENMADVERLLKGQGSYHVGIGLDGDADRMAPMTKSGRLVPGDQLLALYSKKIVANHPGAAVVFDIKSSEALVQALNEMGAVPCVAPSGHSIIKAYLREKKAKLAGELSCHFFFNDRYFGYDDGIYAALRLFELLDESDSSLDDMLEQLPKRVSSPEYRIACKEEEKVAIIKHVEKTLQQKNMTLLTIDGVRASTPYGWGLVRASNTQAVICLRFEAASADGLVKIENDFIDALRPYYPEKTLRGYFEAK